MDSVFCEQALKEAVARFGKPALFNTDQGSQFASNSFTQILQDQGTRVSMECRCDWRDNVYIEKPWRTVRYKDIYLHGYENLRALRRGLASYFDFYNGTDFIRILIKSCLISAIIHCRPRIRQRELPPNS